MSLEKFDCIVIGLGGMGSATLFELKKLGLHVMGLEQFSIPHDKGSSHGLSRIIRLAYFEHPSYIPLLKRSYERWKELEEKSKEELFIKTGSIDASLPEEHIFSGSLESCQKYNLEHEVLDGAHLGERFPGYDLPKNFKAVYQPDGGILIPEKCIKAFTNQALKKGAVVKEGEKVLSIEKDPYGVIITTNQKSYIAKKAVVTAGAWIGELIPHLEALHKPVRQVMGWFQPDPEQEFRKEVFPVFNLGVEEGHFYGFPSLDKTGLKIGKWQHLNEETHPDQLKTEINEKDEMALRDCLKYFPKANGKLLDAKACMFTNTPDENFLIYEDPNLPVVSASGFSGHGFKFCSVIGEIMGDLITKGKTNYDIDLFSIKRFKDG